MSGVLCPPLNPSTLSGTMECETHVEGLTLHMYMYIYMLVYRHVDIQLYFCSSDCSSERSLATRCFFNALLDESSVGF